MVYLLRDELAPVEVVEAGSRLDVLNLLEHRQLDLVLTSIFTAEGDSDQFLNELLRRAPAGRLIILSGMNEPRTICQVLSAGAAGYIPKETAPEITLQAIRLVLAGGIYIPPAALSSLGQGGGPVSSGAASANGVNLTERQQAVLGQLARGASNKEIARSLDLSAGTVKAHVSSLLRIYGAENRTELVSALNTGGPSTVQD
jgi:DNA-binding NarL/FixJ family response regulator